MRLLRIFVACLAGGVLLTASPQAVEAQARGSEAEYETRAELERERADLEQRVEETERDSEEGARVREELSRVRERLEEGDFRTGDAVEIRIPGSDTLSGVFQVDARSQLRVPAIGEIDLSGVLYSEADSVIGRELRRYVRSERIDVRPLKRVAVLGSVGDPGFYDVPPSITLSDLLMQAGGPTQNSDLESLELRRDGRTLASAEEGLRESSTLAELGVERGDQLRVPEESGGTPIRTYLSIFGAVSTVVYAATRIF